MNTFMIIFSKLSQNISVIMFYNYVLLSYLFQVYDIIITFNL